jgi:hypothetical protein
MILNEPRLSAGRFTVCLVAFLAMAVAFAGCVKGKSVWATAELGKGIGAQRGSGSLADLCAFYNEKVVPKQSIWDCEKARALDETLAAAAFGLDKYSTELVKTLKIKKDADTAAQIVEAFTILGGADLGKNTAGAAKASTAFDAVSKALDLISGAVFDLLRGNRVAEAVEKADAPIAKIKEATHELVAAYIDTRLAWDDPGQGNDVVQVGDLVKPLQAQILRDIVEGGCALPQQTVGRLTCADACSEALKSVCLEFKERSRAASAGLLRYDAALEAFAKAHGALRAESTNLKKVIRDKELDDGLKEKIIADARAVYKAAAELMIRK